MRDGCASRASLTLERGIVGGARIRAFSGNLQDPPLPEGAERPVLRGDTQEEIPRMVATLRARSRTSSSLTGPRRQPAGEPRQPPRCPDRCALAAATARSGAVLGNDEECEEGGRGDRARETRSSRP
jgi:phospholipid/cholesterol/gamma-HCH transport system substrate-binding protein